MTVRELKNVKLSHVSYVDKAANNHKFFFTKSANKPTFQKEVKIITKSEDPQKLVYGVVYEPGVADLHNDIMNAEEIEKAAHDFMKTAQSIDTQHDFVAGAGELVESYIAPADFEINGVSIQKGTWVIATKATDDIWDKIQSGEITGYSMAGEAEVEEEDNSNNETGVLKSFMGHMKAFFVGQNTTDISKGEVRDNYVRNQQKRNIWAAWDSLEDAYYGAKWDNYTNEAIDFKRLQDAVQDFAEIIAEIQTGGDVAIASALEIKPEATLTTLIEKAGKKISSASMSDIETAQVALQNIIDRVSDEGEEELKLEDITKAVEQVLAPINDRLDKIEKSQQAEPPVDPIPEPTAQPDVTAESITAAVTKALEPVNERLTKIEKSRGVSQQGDPGVQQIQKSEHFLKGIL